MTDIVVVRFAGDKEGDDVIDELLSTDAVALSRGRAEMESRSTAQVERLLRVPYTAGLLTGQTVQVSDALQGETYIGKIIGLDYEVVLASATMNITLEVPSGFFS